MPIMGLDKVRVVDPILTKVVQGYGTPNFIGDALFPEVSVMKRAGYIIKFGKEDFALFDTRRAPGARTKRRQPVFSSEQYSLYQDALEGELPLEYLEESDGLPLDLQREAAEGAKYSVDLRLEYDRAKLATDATKYDSNHKVTLSGTSQWSNTASKPKTAVNTWREVIRASTGMYPNTMVIGPGAFNALDVHAEIRDQFKYVSDDSLTTDMLRRYFNIEKVVIGTSVIQDEATGDTVDIWGNNLVLAYVPTNVSTRKIPSYGYTYTLKGYPMAEKPYYDNNHRTWYFPVFAERVPVLTAQGAGFLATAVA